MKSWFRGKRGGLIAFLMICGLVTGGLGWVTSAALRLEWEHLQARAEAEHYAQLRLALWRLDSVMIPELAREASRPFGHYSAVNIPAAPLNPQSMRCEPGSILELSPLINAELPEWMLLHFSIAPKLGAWSPQVLSDALQKRLKNVTEIAPPSAEKCKYLAEIQRELQPEKVLAAVRELEKQVAARIQLPNDQNSAVPLDRNARDGAVAPFGQGGSNLGASNLGGFQGGLGQSQNDFANRSRATYADVVRNQDRGNNPAVGKNENPKLQPSNSLNWSFGELSPNGEALLMPGQLKKLQEDVVQPGPLTGLWLRGGDAERLILARHVEIGKDRVCQGILLDWDKLKDKLAGEVSDLFPEATLQPMHAQEPPHPERTMTALPVELDPGPLPPLEDPGWTPLRIGLLLAWIAALVALSAVGLGGWSLIDLSQRRIRFVSTVTHELRTPLTTLRLYLDMLTGGMVREEKQKEEYLSTLNAETDRLNRLVSNVLDFSRLENQQPRLEKSPVGIGSLFEQLAEAWHNRCKECDKELILDNALGAAATVTADEQLIKQLLGNLIDNACKYSTSSADKRIWLRAKSAGQAVVFEVEDRGPGVPKAERRSIFRPFCRGKDADVTAAGVGLGLALAGRWAALLGGRLTVHTGDGGAGACFRLELPAV